MRSILIKNNTDYVNSLSKGDLVTLKIPIHNIKIILLITEIIDNKYFNSVVVYSENLNYYKLGQIKTRFELESYELFKGEIKLQQ